MSANLDTRIPAVYAKADGKPWHGEGIAIEDSVDFDASVEAALAASAGNGSEVLACKLMVVLPDGSMVEHPTKEAIVRAYDGNVAPGTVGKDTFSPPQPLNLIDTGRNVVGGDNPNAKISFLSWLDGGRKFVVSINCGSVQINGEKHTRFLTLHTGIDGSSSTEVILSIVRAVCANTVASAVSDAKRGGAGKAYGRVRRTKNAPARLAALGMTMRDTLEAFGILEKKLTAYADAKITDTEVDTILGDVAAKAGWKKDTTKTKNKIRDLKSIYRKSGWAGTMNGVHQAVTDRDWLAGQARTGKAKGADMVDRMLTHSMFGTGAKFRDQAADVLDAFMARGDARLAAPQGIDLASVGMDLA